ncbi:Uncharacterized protein OBRU01_00551 [Operophtera brumata]|uniref:Uncharacterized protein n=1 Tax=Operophtera brumata TaxID=104452 RepID=A0A0L7LVD6_OPEBR|nr:Uncharacterized protein OBRU01_00551 [Operophtera brumata]
MVFLRVVDTSSAARGTHLGHSGPRGTGISPEPTPRLTPIKDKYAPKPRRPKNFREQRIDGAGLPLLTEDHLTGMLQMKLGPALKLRAVLARRLEPCATCHVNSATVGTAPAVSILQNNSPKVNGALKPEPRSNTTSPS